MRMQVEAMKRHDTYMRSRLLAKIRSETSKAKELLSQRAALQEQRKRANMCAPAKTASCAALRAAKSYQFVPCHPPNFSASKYGSVHAWLQRAWGHTRKAQW